jgi:hypothetical protein
MWSSRDTGTLEGRNKKAALERFDQGLLLGMSNYRLALLLEGVFEVSELPQQTGVLLTRRQQVHPLSTMQETQSQQACSISQQRGSPLVQVMQTPESVISYLHMPMAKLQQHTTMPFMVMQQLHIPPANMVHRFCTMLQAILSSQEQVILRPPVHFSILKVQRGTIIQLVPTGIPVGLPIAGVPMVGIPMPGIPIPVRSTIIALDMN